MCGGWTRTRSEGSLSVPGEMPLAASDTCLPALLGVQYPDPLGSDLSVPVLGCHTDPISGVTTPLAGTMEDPHGKGTGAHTLSSHVLVQRRHDGCSSQVWSRSATALRLWTQ